MKVMQEHELAREVGFFLLPGMTNGNISSRFTSLSSVKMEWGPWGGGEAVAKMQTVKR